MKNINSLEELRTEIALLELRQKRANADLKENLLETFDSLKPLNLVKSTLKELTSSPGFKGDLVNSFVGIGLGYVSKKVLIGNTHNMIKQVIGTMIQFGVTGLVSRNADGLKSGLKNAFNSLFKKKEEEVLEQ